MTDELQRNPCSVDPDYVDDERVKPKFRFRRLTDCTAQYTDPDGFVFIYRRCAACNFWRPQDLWFDYYDGSKKWSSYCKPCAVNLGKKRDYKAERRSLKERAFIMVGDVCEVCGEGRKPVLDFHHEDIEFAKKQRDEKWNRRRRWYYVINHPKEFRVLCKNCHYLEHHPHGYPVDG